MRRRAGTHPVTLDPPEVVELLALARLHDEKLKEARQDLFRAETKLGLERMWRWPIRFAFLMAGIVGVIAWQNRQLRSGVRAFFDSVFGRIRESGIETLVGLLVGGLVVTGLVFLIMRLARGPSPEQRARKLMKQFARTDGVAAYVFTDDDNAQAEAEVVNALTRRGAKRMRQRRLTQDNRPLASSMLRILNQQVDGVGPVRTPQPADNRPIVRSENI